MSENMIAPVARQRSRRCAWTSEERTEWLRLLDESGQGVAEFCRESDLPESTVSLWRKQLRDPAGDIRGEEEFIELKLPAAPQVAASPSLTVTIYLSGSVTFAVPVGTDAVWLADVIRQPNSLR